MEDINTIIHCDAYDKEVNSFECKSCCIRRKYGIPEYRECPYYGKYIRKVVTLKADDLHRIKEYSKRKGGNPVNHYIREAVAEYLENHE